MHKGIQINYQKGTKRNQKGIEQGPKKSQTPTDLNQCALVCAF